MRLFMVNSSVPLWHNTSRSGGTSRRNNSPCVTQLISWKSLSLWQNFVAATSRTNSNHSDKISESSIVASCVHFRQQVTVTKYKWTNERASYGQPYWIRKLDHIPPHTTSLGVHRTVVVSQRLVSQVVHMEQLVAESCRCDLSPSVSRPLYYMYCLLWGNLLQWLILYNKD